jgi:hypothetical protein
LEESRRTLLRYFLEHLGRWAEEFYACVISARWNCFAPAALRPANYSIATHRSHHWSILKNLEAGSGTGRRGVLPRLQASWRAWRVR